MNGHANVCRVLLDLVKTNDENAMNQRSKTSLVAILMAVLGGAAIGGFAVAFAKTKIGKHRRNSLPSLTGRICTKAGPLDQMDDELEQAMFI